MKGDKKEIILSVDYDTAVKLFQFKMKFAIRFLIGLTFVFIFLVGLAFFLLWCFGQI